MVIWTSITNCKTMTSSKALLTAQSVQKCYKCCKKLLAARTWTHDLRICFSEPIHGGDNDDKMVISHPDRSYPSGSGYPSTDDPMMSHSPQLSRRSGTIYGSTKSTTFGSTTETIFLSPQPSPQLVFASPHASPKSTLSSSSESTSAGTVKFGDSIQVAFLDSSLRNTWKTKTYLVGKVFIRHWMTGRG